jgi:hypothetical protein
LVSGVPIPEKLGQPIPLGRGRVWRHLIIFKPITHQFGFLEFGSNG